MDDDVYKKLMQVPEGKVTTYGELARAVGLKNGQRVIGRIMNRNRFPGVVPCHRVVLSDGDVGGYAYGQDIKINMLTDEGVEIRGRKILDFEKRVHRF